MADLYIGLGSNLGNKEAQIKTAMNEIETRIGTIVIQSGFFYSVPWGFDSNNHFVNACALIRTEIPPLDCLTVLKNIEKGMGRLKTGKSRYEDRLIDLDILIYDQWIYSDAQLTIPHPHLHQRMFVLKPLMEIAPNLIHPSFKQTIITLYEALSEREKNSSDNHKL